MPTDRTAPFPRVLTVAGSDSGGGAGIQADLKTFAALGAYGMSVITAVTAQNTSGIQAVHPLPPELIAAQYQSVRSDIRIDALKIGMLPDCRSIETVADLIRQQPPPFVVLDPVLTATSGDALTRENTITTLIGCLLPLADLCTPNLDELSALSGQTLAQTETEILQQGRILQNLGARALLLKGGHWHDGDTATDWLLTADGTVHRFTAPRLNTGRTHGTGCTLSAALAAILPRQTNLSAAVREAKAYLHGALAAGLHWRLGAGGTPPNHAWRQTATQTVPICHDPTATDSHNRKNR